MKESETHTWCFTRVERRQQAGFEGPNVFACAFPRMELLHLLTHSQAPFSRVIQSLRYARMEFFKTPVNPGPVTENPI